MSYAEQLEDIRWKRKRIEILKRDKFTCQICGYMGERVNVHHLKYTGMAWDAPDEDLITLCKGCHNKTHTPALSDKRLSNLKLTGSRIITAILNEDGEKIY